MQRDEVQDVEQATALLHKLTARLVRFILFFHLSFFWGGGVHVIVFAHTRAPQLL